jgi:hypothetical protein
MATQVEPKSARFRAVRQECEQLAVGRPAGQSITVLGWSRADAAPGIAEPDLAQLRAWRVRKIIEYGARECNAIAIWANRRIAGIGDVASARSV